MVKMAIYKEVAIGNQKKTGIKQLTDLVILIHNEYSQVPTAPNDVIRLIMQTKFAIKNQSRFFPRSETDVPEDLKMNMTQCRLVGMVSMKPEKLN